jgi:hypothetical protein
MPTDDALGPDQDQVPAPVTAESAGRNPEELIAGAKPRSLPGRPGRYRQLMAEQEILGDEWLAVALGRTDQAEQKHQKLEHRPNIMPLKVHSRPGRLLHPDRCLPNRTARRIIWTPLRLLLARRPESLF